MPPSPNDSTRRAFLGQALTLGAGSLLAGPALAAPAANTAGAPSPMPTALPDLPARVLIDHDGTGFVTCTRQKNRFTSAQAAVVLAGGGASQAVKVSCPTGPLSRVILRWEISCPEDTLYLGDAWERGYGDLQWRHLQPERILPWYFAAHHVASGRTFLAGVKTQPAKIGRAHV